MIIKNLQKNKGHVPYEAKSFRSGFVILFAVTLSAILLSIALGVANIALKEIKFSTSEKDSNEALFAADVGIECALFNDKTESSIFVSLSSPSLNCNPGMDVITADENPPNYWSFVILGLGNSTENCARVTVDKTNPVVTTIISKGYNKGDSSCGPIGENRIERELKVSY